MFNLTKGVDESFVKYSDRLEYPESMKWMSTNTHWAIPIKYFNYGDKKTIFNKAHDAFLESAFPSIYLPAD